MQYKQSCSKQDKATFTYRNVANFYELVAWSRHLNTKFTPVKNADPNKYECSTYSGHGMEFDRRSQVLIGEWGKNVVADIISSSPTENKKKNVLMKG